MRSQESRKSEISIISQRESFPVFVKMNIIRKELIYGSLGIRELIPGKVRALGANP